MSQKEGVGRRYPGEARLLDPIPRQFLFRLPLLRPLMEESLLLYH